MSSVQAEIINTNSFCYIYRQTGTFPPMELECPQEQLDRFYANNCTPVAEELGVQLFVDGLNATTLNFEESVEICGDCLIEALRYYYYASDPSTCTDFSDDMYSGNTVYGLAFFGRLFLVLILVIIIAFMIIRFFKRRKHGRT